MASSGKDTRRRKSGSAVAQEPDSSGTACGAADTKPAAAVSADADREAVGADADREAVGADADRDDASGDDDLVAFAAYRVVDDLNDRNQAAQSLPDTSYVQTVQSAQIGERLDAFVSQLASVSRALAQKLLADACVHCNGVVIAKPAYRVRAADRIAVRVPAPVPLAVRAEPIPLEILFEDEHLIVLNKPAGMVVHPAPGHVSGTLVNALLHHCRDLSGIGGVLRPGIVHRLDKDTSGVMVVSKHDSAHQGLAEAFAAKSRGESGVMARSYLAICVPGPGARLGAEGSLRTLYGRHPVHRKLFSSKVQRGKPAVSHWKIVSLLAHHGALVEFRLETGRTHQIRVHAADHGFAVFGDATYGVRQRQPALQQLAAQLNRQALHAHTLVFAHPVTGAVLQFTAPLPADMQYVLSALTAD